MRITSQMLERTSRETGLPLTQGGLLDALNKQDTSTDFMDALNKNQYARQASAMQDTFHKLEDKADDLNKSASKLTETGGSSLFGKADEIKDTKDIVAEIMNMIESYNKTLELLKDADGSLNDFYYKELKNVAAESAEQLKSVGITQNKDGSLTVDEKILNDADYDTLKEVFGSESKFTNKTEYISGRVSENAQARLASLSNQYNEKGISYSDSFEANKYDFFG